MTKCICVICGKEFNCPPSRIKLGGGKYCSSKCYHFACRQKDEIFYEKDYAYILLTKNNETKKILFDVSCVDEVKKYKWHLHYRKSDGRYDVCTNIPGTHKDKNRYMTMTRYLLNYKGNLQIDHINRNTLDNRIQNLRIVTSYENNQNKEGNHWKGITWDKSRNKWKATIQYNGTIYNLGRFDELRDAILRRRIAERNIVKMESA